MEFSELVEILTDPRVYPHPCDSVELHQTHISAVFLAGSYAYKIKKPLDLGFLDFSTLGKRHRYCLEEVRLNRRLAPNVYLGVLPITVREGEVRVDGGGKVAEWAVWMQRLPEDATLQRRIARSDVSIAVFRELARRVTAFHQRAESGDHVSAYGRWAVVARNARENFEQSAAHVGRTVSGAVFTRSLELTETQLDRLRGLIESRAQRGVPRDTHGDLHLDHVYWLPDRLPPDDLTIVDCVEFNERFRYADPVADTAFLTMDLAYCDRRDLARRFSREYFEISGDAEGRELLPFYAGYRAAVRGKVEGLKALEPEVPRSERDRALAAARAHWLVGLGWLESAGRRPCLVCVGGLPGTGKSTLANQLSEHAGFSVIRTDSVRKELAGLSPGESAAAGFGEGLYRPEWDERTYAEVLRRTEEGLFLGKRILVDASFREDARRRNFLQAARLLGVPGILFLCDAEPNQVRERLGARRGDVSDADWDTYEKAAVRWEELSALVVPKLHRIRTDGPPHESASAALTVLRSEELA